MRTAEQELAHGGRHRRGTSRVKRAAAVIWMNTLIGAVLGIAAVVAGLPALRVPDASWSVRAVTLFAIWVLSFVPGWLYVRFLGLRADALWNEYVLNLYRLGLDEPACLPPPPAESVYSRLPGAAQGGQAKQNIYRQKFDAYYGRKVSARSSDTESFRVSVDTLFPVFLCTATLAVAWTVILWNPVVLVSPTGPWATLEFGFLGAYAFAVSMLVRRFYQSDLRPSAYAAVVVRIVLVLLILTVLQQMFAVEAATSDIVGASQYVTAFVVGFFPLAGLQALQRIAAKTLRVLVPQLAPEYPLEQLDGLNIWYEARLAEEGVEDMQNLTTMNLVDVILHTRAPVGRLIDWIDQAFLLIHLDPEPRDDSERSGTRAALRRAGVRSATDLLTAFRAPAGDLRARGLDPDRIETLLRLLAAEAGLDPVWNWKGGGAGRNTRPPAPNRVEPRKAASVAGTSRNHGVRHRSAIRTAHR
ncbi:MAG TPA: hypothetical protein VE442_18570 [Jatrophihabitans sp.]|nr:hypothetical protein [Jatrophihabitans sp.]